jgi:hypothetical protein
LVSQIRFETISQNKNDKEPQFGRANGIMRKNKMKFDKGTEKKGRKRRLQVPISVSRFQESSKESQKKKIKRSTERRRQKAEKDISCPVRKHGVSRMAW